MAADNTAQRQDVARQAIAAATNFVNSYYELLRLADERAKFSSPWIDSDFTGVSGLTQTNAAQMGGLFDFVVDPAQANGTNGLAKWFADAGNGARNMQTLLQIQVGALQP